MASVALAYSQVNDSFAGFVSGDQSSAWPVKKGAGRSPLRPMLPRGGDGERAKTLPTQNPLNQNRPLNPLSHEREAFTPLT